LLVASAAGAGGGGGAGFATGGAGFSAAGFAGATLDGGMSVMACGFDGVAGAAAFSGLAASAGGGFASSSAMMRRIEARISSIEGSVTFAGCVISDSTSSTPSHALFYTKHGRIGRFRNGRPVIFVAAARLVPRSRLNVQRCAPAPALKHYAHDINAGPNRPASFWQGYVRDFDDCKQSTGRPRLSARSPESPRHDPERCSEKIMLEQKPKAQ
jgi:hypothetical protein